MTMTRSMDQHQYLPAPYAPQVGQGFARTEVVNKVPTTWAIARPTAFPTPLYSPPAAIPRGSGVGFSPAQPNVMMDPSDPHTWQRQYRFTR